MRLAPTEVLTDIAKILAVQMSDLETQDLAAKLEGLREPWGAATYDHTSLPHPNHRFGGEVGGWMTKLTHVQASLIADRFRPWMRKYGYSLKCCPS